MGTWSGLWQREAVSACLQLPTGEGQSRGCAHSSLERGSNQLSKSRKLLWAGGRTHSKSGLSLETLLASSEQHGNVWSSTHSYVWSHQTWPSQRFCNILCILLLNPFPPRSKPQLTVIFTGVMDPNAMWHTSSGPSHSVLCGFALGRSLEYISLCLIF